MKQLFIILFTFLLLAPPMQAHTDVVVFNEVPEHHLDFESDHKEQHKNDSEQEKNQEHHHHCNSISLINIFLPVENQVIFSKFSENNKLIIFYKNADYSSYLETIFQPPRNFKLFLPENC
ncbi:hypothetical protein [Polaribacter cellanae]|uniref:DUF2796 domain-containing protein n=1 Tax=Polaribacter cellanae TaxID=2818493 RepID=A0A975CTR6_9FLAO|nr:hypothetical protein [Polaribacter cellanae]QTE23246.1 hypothetical protein J3359_02920 [Polaribacter cellanae]